MVYLGEFRMHDDMHRTNTLMLIYVNAYDKRRNVE